jgi:hypothetical protein
MDGVRGGLAKEPAMIRLRGVPNAGLKIARRRRNVTREEYVAVEKKIWIWKASPKSLPMDCLRAAELLKTFDFDTT